MEKIKNVLTGLLWALPLLMMFTGCDKFLDRKPLTATLDDLKQGGVEGQIYGLYGGIRNPDVAGIGFGGINWLGMHALRSDDQEIIADPGAGGWRTTYDLFQYVKDDWSTNEYWNRHYVLIGLANTALQTIDSLGLNDPPSLVNAAEARWFRAYSYFELVRTYGQVPLINFRVYDAAQAQIPKSTEDQIYAQIDEDLSFATQYLPINWVSGGTSKYPGRLTSGASKTLHAKTLLYRKQWGAALALLQSVIDSKQYSLTDDYWKIWKTSGENNQESIFEIQAYQSAGKADDYWSWWGTQHGIRGAQGSQWDLGWGWNTPTQSLVDAYEAGDRRKGATILFSGQSDDPSNGGYGKTLPDYPAIPAKYWNKKCYADPAEQLAIGDIHGAAYINQRILRYSDVLLMAAEAANEVGGAQNEALAVEYVNQIRNRAGLADISFVSKDDMRKIIKQERRIEFAMEGERFFDLVRWGDAETILSGLGYQNKHRYYPLPTPALSSNPKLVQNPEWP
jgi:hypothetical protein